jgi:hypothetical protein
MGDREVAHELFASVFEQQAQPAALPRDSTEEPRTTHPKLMRGERLNHFPACTLSRCATSSSVGDLNTPVSTEIDAVESRTLILNAITK